MRPTRLSLASAPLLALLLFPAILPRAEGQALTNPLTAEQVACNERQLVRLTERIIFGDPVADYGQIIKTILVSYSNSSGFYEGLALTTEDWRRGPFETLPSHPPEYHLAFNLNPSLRRLLLNPGRPVLGQVSLNREQSSSNFVSPGGPFDLVVKVDPTLDGSPDPSLLEINNFEIPAPGQPYNGFLANSTKPGRGLDQDGLLTPCHDRFTSFDRHVFAILQRIVRATVRSYTFYIALDMKMSIFRGEEPGVYRVNIYPIDAYSPDTPDPTDSGQVALEVELTWSPEGRIRNATVRGLPLCNGDERLNCTYSQAATSVELIAPSFAGVNRQSKAVTVFYYDPAASPNFSPPETVDLEELLADTTWNDGFP